MGYIDSSEVKAIRTAIKQNFPKYKFSITRQHFSSVYVKIMSGPTDLGPHTQINEYWVEKIENPVLKELALNLLKTIHNVKAPKYRETGDYGQQPDYYLHLQVGSWDKPYTMQ